MVDIVSSDPNSPEFKRLHEVLGRALTTWQEVESSLFDVFFRVSSCTHENVALAIFYSPHDFSEKLKCTHNAARMALNNNDMLGDWKMLRKRMINASEVRNALAHFILIRDTEFDAQDEVISSRLRLHPNFQDVTEEFRTRKPTVQNLDADDIIGHTVTFRTLLNDVKAFAHEIPQT